jgi:hypothetical protein
VKQQLVRDGAGRILGTVGDYWNDEDDSYFDYKERDLMFPIHSQTKCSEVTTYHISELKNK